MLVTAPMPAPEAALDHAAALLREGERRTTAEVDIRDSRPERGPLEELLARDGGQAQAWVSYLAEATEVFACLLDARSVGVRLVVSDAPHCPRLHVDRVTARMEGYTGRCG